MTAIALLSPTLGLADPLAARQGSEAGDTFAPLLAPLLVGVPAPTGGIPPLPPGGTEAPPPALPLLGTPLPPAGTPAPDENGQPAAADTVAAIIAEISPGFAEGAQPVAAPIPATPRPAAFSAPMGRRSPLPTTPDNDLPIATGGKLRAQVEEADDVPASPLFAAPVEVNAAAALQPAPLDGAATLLPTVIAPPAAAYANSSVTPSTDPVSTNPVRRADAGTPDATAISNRGAPIAAPDAPAPQAAGTPRDLTTPDRTAAPMPGAGAAPASPPAPPLPVPAEARTATRSSSQPTRSSTVPPVETVAPPRVDAPFSPTRFAPPAADDRRTPPALTPQRSMPLPTGEPAPMQAVEQSGDASPGAAASPRPDASAAASAPARATDPPFAPRQPALPVIAAPISALARPVRGEAVAAIAPAPAASAVSPTLAASPYPVTTAAAASIATIAAASPSPAVTVARADRLDIKPEPTVAPTAPFQLSIPAATPATASAILPALQAFGAALHRAAAAERRPRLSEADALTPLAVTAPAAPVVGAGPAAPLDTTVPRWPEAMVQRIEQIRDQQDAADTRIRLHPDALGAVDVALRRDGDGVHIHLHAAEPAARALLAEAQPRLAELAEAKGLKLAGTQVDGSGAQDSRQDRRQPAAPAQAPRSARAAAPDTVDDHDTRLA